jgi:formiminotetrahydrofolate cyclodeaminase
MDHLDRVLSSVYPAGFSGQTLQRLLELFAGGFLVPGGGSAAGIASALGVSLLTMVATLSRKASIPSLASDELGAATAHLRLLRDRLVHLAELDIEAYAQVIDARRLARDTPAQHLARHSALQRAIRGATEVPLDMMHVCEEALQCGVVVSNLARTGARSDLAIGIELISVALHGAARAVDANLSRFDDEDYVARATEQSRRFEASGEETVNLLRAMVGV